MVDVQRDGHQIPDQIHQLNPQPLIGGPKEIHQQESFIYLPRLVILERNPDGLELVVGGKFLHFLDDRIHGESLLETSKQKGHKPIEKSLLLSIV